ncbi:MAG TPA: carboxypeptidase-like regulatory domain-containing protein [Terriglobales bacterium]|nr:carboxypeptidase-like regulatory domain-containing protein [Terriglobales bacterium]
MKAAWLLALLAITSVPSPASDKNNNDVGPVATLNFVVVKDYNGKPVRNAAVILHEVGDKGKQEKGGLELKTDLDGKASYEGVPYGKFRIQVIATGFQTFGADYEIDQPTLNISIKLKRPEAQYSVYQDHPNEKKDNPQ